MRKTALMFVAAVFVPSLVLAWLAVGSVRDQQIVAERRLTLLYHGITESVSRDLLRDLDAFQHSFHEQVQALVQGKRPPDLGDAFDENLRQLWPYAEVAYLVSLDGRVLVPSLFAGPDARKFRLENDRFLCGRESVEVYWNKPQNDQKSAAVAEDPVGDDASNKNPSKAGKKIDSSSPNPEAVADSTAQDVKAAHKGTSTKSAATEKSSSKINVETAHFQKLIGDSPHGTFARFLQDQLNLMFWFRLPAEPEYVFGAKVRLDKLVDRFQSRLQVDSGLTNEICVALLNDLGKPVAQTSPGFFADWKQPFVSTELGEILPHWEVAAYLRHPDQLTRSASLLKVTISLFILLLVVAIAVGGWLLTSDLNRQLTLARQKTDFVSNVTHELKTPLTSIRMFAELLAEGRVQEESKKKVYLEIIGSETARLTRLINNVLDFSRIERGEKQYQMQAFNVAGLVEEVYEMLRPNLEAKGFNVQCHLPDRPVEVTADHDALAQVLVNLISNAEKYGDPGKSIEITVHPAASSGNPSEAGGKARVTVEDRGPGVPPGCADKIFEQFFRAHDSLDSGVEGSGLGLTLARQIARAHQGDVLYQPRPGGGSCFILELPANNCA